MYESKIQQHLKHNDIFQLYLHKYKNVKAANDEQINKCVIGLKIENPEKSKFTKKSKSRRLQKP